jgi:prepilin-type N-terminal cleavage/methylation domain-containing protein
MLTLRNNNGFTLVEIMVVITLISIMLAFAVPNFQSLTTDTTKETNNWIVLTVKMLKQGALQNKKNYTLHVSMESNKMWYTAETDDDEEGEEEDKEESKSLGEYKIPEGLKIVDVEFPEEEQISSGEVEINFYVQGFSDRAIIHIEDEDDDKELSYVIEAFLIRVKIHDEFVGFDS